MARPYLFLFGFPRSGTTLLRSMLAQHPDIDLAQEPEVLSALVRSGLSGTTQIEPDDLSSFVERRCRDHNPSRRFFEAHPPLPPMGPMNLRAAYDTLVPRPIGVSVWGDKSLHTGRVIAEVAEAFPEALFVHIVRDPRSAIASRYRKNRGDADTALSLGYRTGTRPWRRILRHFSSQSALWVECVRSARQGSASANDRYVEVSYESLLAAPTSVLAPICNALGLDFDERMLDHNARRSDPILNSEAAFGHSRLAAPLDASRAVAHISNATFLNAIIESVAGATMADLGYERVANPVARLAAAPVVRGIRRRERS